MFEKQRASIHSIEYNSPPSLELIHSWHHLKLLTLFLLPVNMTLLPFYIPLDHGSAGSSSGSFEGHTLLLPTVSHASVPQLAVDLLITDASLGLKRVGRLDAAQDLIPFVGFDEGSSSGITTPLEVYSNPARKLTVIQQRSPVLKTRKSAFVRRLSEWIRSQGFAQTLILSSIDASLRLDAELEMQQPVVQYVPASSSTSQQSTSAPLLSQMSKKLPALTPVNPSPSGAQGFPAQPSTETAEKAIMPKRDFPPSTGLTHRLLSALVSPSPAKAKADTGADRPVPCGALFIFVAEGDNRPDAHYQAALALDLWESSSSPSGAGNNAAQVRTFTEPQSWRCLFGNTFDQALFG